MPRFLTALAASAAALVVLATPAFAHVEFEPSSAEAGATPELTLFAENEQGSPITKIELSFPEDTEIVVADVPTPDGWTVTVVGGEIGGPASGITWEGSEPEDAELPLTLGPLPDDAQRLQFKAIVTYENGTQDAWITDWPEGAEEPENPGPVLDVVAAGETPVTEGEGEEHDDEVTETTVEEEHDDEVTETTAATATTDASDEQASGEDEDDDDNGSLLGVLIGGAVIVGLGALGGFLYMRTRKA